MNYKRFVGSVLSFGSLNAIHPIISLELGYGLQDVVSCASSEAWLLHSDTTEFEDARCQESYHGNAHNVLSSGFLTTAVKK